MLAVLTAGGLGLAGCGGSSDEATAVTTTAATAATAAETLAKSDDPFCVQVEAATEKFGLGGDAPTNLTAAMANLPEAAALLEEAAATAPDELKADLGVLATTLAAVAPGMTQMAQLSAEAATDPSKQEALKEATAGFQADMAKLQTPEFVQAFDRLNAYAKDHCGISFS